MEFPKKKYKIIYADPPWKYDDQGCRGTMAGHYNGMDLENIKKLPVKNLADKNCVLFMWVTYPKLKESLEVIKAWGFNYKSIAFQWIKLNKNNNKPFYGLGRWTRGNTECCLLATKGKPKRKDNSVFQLVFSPLREHSQKPDEVRHLIVKLMGDLPRIELFARTRIQGWDSWGNDVPNECQTLIKDIKGENR